jgi:multidrug efflux pump subunit AcrA (membrane-fusion protein)
MFRMTSSSQYTEAERNNAKLPLAPEEDSQLQVLLRPGLLSDVEIIVEKIPNALHVPAQAVFQKNGKSIVYVMASNRKFEPREIKLVKRSESMMVIQSGVNPGEVVSLSDPTASKTDKKGKSDKKGGGAAPVMPAGGGKQ